MATARIRNNDWQEDKGLKEALTRYVKENLRRNEVLDFVSRDFSDYAWSLRTLGRRLQYFGITYTDRTVQVDAVEDAVKEEMQGPGKLLGYRALHKKLSNAFAPLFWCALQGTVPTQGYPILRFQGIALRPMWTLWILRCQKLWTLSETPQSQKARVRC